MDEPDVSELIGVARAIEIIDGEAVTPRITSVHLADALGLVLAQAIVADRDEPAFDKSLMDGFAVRAEDVEQLPVELRVVGEIAAGRSSERILGRGETMAIMTGAPLPNGAQGVVPVEEVEKIGDSTVRVSRAGDVRRYVARRGHDCKQGQTLLEPGTVLGPSQLAVAAAAGVSLVKAYSVPTVAILSTGDELVELHESPGPTQLRNSSESMLAALMKREGIKVRGLGIVGDDPAMIRAAIEKGLLADTLLITGGMSVGTHDYVPGILGELGCKFKITRLRIKPGKPFVFARHPNGCHVFGLPGNPVSAFVCTVRLALRLLRRMAARDPEPRWLTGSLTENLPANGPREFYQPGIWKSYADKEATVTPLAWKGSADIYTLAKANVLLVRPGNAPALSSGTLVRVMEI